MGLAFPPSVFGNEHYLDVVSGRPMAQMLAGALPLLAALVPAPHTVEIFDGNVRPLDAARLAAFDIVGVTGMIVQRGAFVALLEELADHPGLLLVGGPYASVDPAFFNGLADVLFIGEADETWPAFFDTLETGASLAPVHVQAERTDMTRLPLPRYDLAERGSYLCASIQFSRGCPFMCEFCDIITIFGRKPRAKTPDMVLAELALLKARGFQAVFIVDDNFIGNKKLARELLVRLVAWQKANGYPFRFSTEASLNLADEPELMALMVEANFTSVFIGIESANPDSLRETRKVQNVRGDSQLDKLARIRDAGLVVIAGFIVGFDSDDGRIFEMQRTFIEEASIAVVSIGPLAAIPSTPLYERLKAQGRLRHDDALCNFEPAQMSAAELRAGFLDLVQRVYTPEAFFGRVAANLARSQTLRANRTRIAARRTPASLRQRAAALSRVAAMGWRFGARLRREGELTNLGPRYLRLYRALRRSEHARMGPGTFLNYAAQHWHYYKLYKDAGAAPVGVFEYTHSQLVPVP